MLKNGLGILALVLGLFSVSPSMAAETIDGTVDIVAAAKKQLTPSGRLFIFAHRAGAPTQGMPPVAVMKVENPQFPVKFSLSSANVMIQGMQFSGALKISARYSPTGDAIDKSGPKGSDEKNESVTPGDHKGIKITLK